MTEKVSFNFGGSSMLLMAIGILNAWKASEPWYLGLAVGLLVSMFLFLGIVPVIGQIVYYIGVKWLLVNVMGIWLPWVFYAGLVLTIIVSLSLGLILIFKVV